MNRKRLIGFKRIKIKDIDCSQNYYNREKSENHKTFVRLTCGIKKKKIENKKLESERGGGDRTRKLEKKKLRDEKGKM